MRRAVLLTAAVGLAACGSTDDGGDAATRRMVLETCAPGGDDPLETEVCECAYDTLRDRFDAEALEDLDRRLRDDPDVVPAVVQEVVLECAFEPVAPPTTKPADDPTTSTTSTSSPSSTLPTSTTSTTARAGSPRRRPATARGTSRRACASA